MTLSPQDIQRFTQAVKTDDTEAMRAVFASNPQAINHLQIEEHLTPLSYAVNANSPDCVKALLELGAAMDSASAQFYISDTIQLINRPAGNPRQAIASRALRLFAILEEEIRKKNLAPGYHDTWETALIRGTKSWLYGDDETRKCWIPCFVTLGIPQHDARMEKGLRAILEVALIADSYANIRQLARHGIDFSPLMKADIIELSDALEVRHLSMHGEQVNDNLLSVRADATAWLKKCFAMGKTLAYQDLFTGKGAPTPALWQVLSTDLTSKLFAPHRWRGHSRAALALQSMILKILPEWRREYLAPQIDLTALLREESPSDHCLATHMAHAAAKRQGL